MLLIKTVNQLLTVLFLSCGVQALGYQFPLRMEFTELLKYFVKIGVVNVTANLWLSFLAFYIGK